MFEDLYAPLPQVDAYLARIGYEGPVGLTEACLDQLVLRHQLSVPFENLDIRIRKTPVSLGIPQLFDKVVTRGRGGFCYELNGLFRALLEALGFRAWCCSCKVLKGKALGIPRCTEASWWTWVGGCSTATWDSAGPCRQAPCRSKPGMSNASAATGICWRQSLGSSAARGSACPAEGGKVA